MLVAGLPPIDKSVACKPSYGFRFPEFGSRKAEKDTNSTSEGTWATGKMFIQHLIASGRSNWTDQAT